MARREQKPVPAEAFDAAIIGAGPAGCSCALWLAEYGLRPLLIDRQAVACATLDDLDFAQEWVLGRQARTLAEIGAGYRAHIAARVDIDKRFDTVAHSMSRLDGGLWRLALGEDEVVDARNVVLATGLSPVHPPAYFNAGLVSDALLDAVSLTRRRASLTGRRVLLLGGGDNAAENALALAAQDNEVTLSSRHALSAQQRFIDRLARCASARVLVGQSLPALQRLRDGYLAQWADGTEARFDIVAVLFGYQGNRELFGMLPPGVGPGDGVFLAGDVSGRMHACVPCAIGDGTDIAWQIERRLTSPARQVSDER